MFEFEVFRKQMYCIEESTGDTVGKFRRPGNRGLLASLVTPCLAVKRFNIALVSCD